jgi:hypothetical protein
MAFHFPCYRRLTSNLGRIDAICGYATLAVDLLSEELQQNNSPTEWLSGTAKLHGLVLHHVDDELLPHRLAQMFIVGVHAQFEEFLVGFLEENEQSRSWSKRSDKESLSHYVLTNVGLIFKAECAIDREVCEYYRLVRNRFSHIELNFQRLENSRAKLRALLDVDKSYEPPKQYDEVDYGDFDLFTRAVKSLAAAICLAARPTDEVLAQMAKSGTFVSLKKYRNNLPRYKKALKQKYLMDFGIDGVESDRIIECFVNGC